MKKLLFLVAFFCSIHSENIFFTDCKNFYSTDSLQILAPTALSCALIANSPIDQRLFDLYDQNINHNDLKTPAKIAKIFGSNKPLSIAFFSCMALSYFTKNTFISKPLFNWCFSSFRAITVAMPTLIVLQNLSGADRPWQHTSSYYKPFKNDHGVSGHAFMGSVPFISAAMMVDNIFAKALFYTASTFTGISRINDRAHYPSQVIFGWMLGFSACNAIKTSNVQTSVSVNSITLAYEF